MSTLAWDDAAGSGGGAGYVQHGTMRITLGMRPPLGFAFEAIDFDDAGARSRKRVDGIDADLTASDLVGVWAVINGLDTANGAALVWGVDENGALLGLVTPAAAFAVTGPQPSPPANFLWDFTRRTWKRQ